MSTTDQRYEALCKKHGIDPDALPSVSRVPDARKKFVLASEKLAVITECYNSEDDDGNVLNVKWVPNYSKGNTQYKYELWFEIIENEGRYTLVYGFINFDCWYVGSNAGSRLCFKTSALALKAFNDFKEYYEDFYLPSC